MHEYGEHEKVQYPGAGGMQAGSLLQTKRPDGGQVTRELERQQAAGVELQTRLGELEDRLGPVRLSTPEAAMVTGMDDPEPVRADLAQAIANGTAQLLYATRRIQTLLHELEI